MNLKPMPLWQSTCLFLIPGMITAGLLLFVFPWLLSHGSDYWVAFYSITIAGFLMLAVIALVLYRREGRALTWSAIKQRLRLKPMDKQAWKYTAVAYVIVLGAYLGLLFTARVYANHFGLPAWYTPPDLDVRGLYGLILIRFLLVVINVLSEEFLWRGMILPRQELTHGKRTWWIHGLQWTLYHLFKPWEFLMLLPGCLAYGWVCTKTQNTTPGIVLHFGLNGLGIVMVTLAVFGVV